MPRREGGGEVSEPRSGTSTTAISALIVLAVLVSYVPAMRAGYVWDDDAYVTRNEQLRSPAGLARIWFVPSATPQYYPAVHTSFWLEYRLWGLAPAGYHAVNIVLHALSAVLLLRLLLFLRFPAAVLGALLFALHPVHVESVAWITERKNVLSGLFYLAALFVALRWFDPDDTRPGEKRRARTLAWAYLLFLLALLSKSVTATLPVVIGIVLYWKRGALRRRDIIALLPFLATGAASGLFTAYLEKTHVGAAGMAWAWSIPERFLIAGRALWFYVGKLVWPSNLIFVYPRWKIDGGTWWQYGFPLSAAAAVLLLWRLRARIGRGPFAAVLCYGITLFPALGFLAVYPMRYSFVADHFQYLASIPILILIAFSLRALFFRAVRGAPARAAGIGFVALLLGVLTWNQCGAYKDEETLWRATIARNPRSSMAHNNLGVLLMREGRVEEAGEHILKAIRIDPTNHEAFAARGNLLARQGMEDEAIESYRRSLEIDPHYALAAYNLGNMYRERGETEKAIDLYRRAIASREGYFGPLLNLSLLLGSLDRWDEAAEVCAEAIRFFPGDERLSDLRIEIEKHREESSPAG